MLSKSARKELVAMAIAGSTGRRGCDVNLRSAPALVKRGLARVEMDNGYPFYVITERGMKALENQNH